jgi:hypothetical protein
MQYLIWAGTALTLGGIVLLGWCVYLATKVRRNTALDEAAARAALTPVLYWNMGALLLSFLGLMLVLVGVILS